jgi:hypothetical protein
MKDFFQMWTQHRADPKNKYPELAKITDDNKDGVIEVNRPEEIDALLAATKAYLWATGFPMEGRRLVWVSDSRAYYSSSESRQLAHEEYEATAYASVYKFSHDVAPARAALGSGGCTDCHRSGSPFFQGAVLGEVFTGNNARPRWVPNYEILGVSSFWVRLGAFREAWLKPVVYGLDGVLLMLFGGLGLGRVLTDRLRFRPRMAALTAIVFTGAGLLALAGLATSPEWLSYVTVRRFTLDANHAWVSLLACALAAGAVLLQANGAGRWVKVQRTLVIGVWSGLVLAALSGALMLLKLNAVPSLTRLGYTGFEIGLALALLTAAGRLVLRFAAAVPGAPSPPRSTRVADADGAARAELYSPRHI